MPEPTTEQTLESELATLRKVNADLLKTKHDQKARIAALEADVLTASEKADKAQAAAHAVVVDRPLKQMVAELSKGNVPELVMRELLADYKFDAGVDGSILVTNVADAKPIAAKNGKAVAWDKHSLHLFLIGDGYAEKSDRQKLYAHLLGIPAASGGVSRKVPGIGITGKQPVAENKPAVLQLGLR